MIGHLCFRAACRKSRMARVLLDSAEPLSTERSMRQLSALLVLTLAHCSGGSAYEGQLESLRQAVVDHTGAVEQAPGTEQARSVTSKYVDSTFAHLQSMMSQAASCPMMDPERMQMAMGTLGAALTRHREAMEQLGDLWSMTREVGQHAAAMMKGIDGLETQYRACNCDHMM